MVSGNCSCRWGLLNYSVMFSTAFHWCWHISYKEDCKVAGDSNDIWWNIQTEAWTRENCERKATLTRSIAYVRKKRRCFPTTGDVHCAISLRTYPSENYPQAEIPHDYFRMLTCSHKSVYIYSKPFWMYSGFPLACDRSISCFRCLQLQQRQRSFPLPCFPLTYCTPNPDTCSDACYGGISEHSCMYPLISSTLHTAYITKQSCWRWNYCRMFSEKRKIYSVTCFLFYISLEKIILGITVCEVQ